MKWHVWARESNIKFDADFIRGVENDESIITWQVSQSMIILTIECERSDDAFAIARRHDRNFDSLQPVPSR